MCARVSGICIRTPQLSVVSLIGLLGKEFFAARVQRASRGGGNNATERKEMVAATAKHQAQQRWSKVRHNVRKAMHGPAASHEDEII